MLISFEYLVKKYGTVKNVLHIGASSGQEADAYYKNGVKHVTWIEAIPAVYDQLCRNISKYKNMVAVNACVSDVDDFPVEFKVTNNEAQSSSFMDLKVHKKEHPNVQVIETIEMRTQRLDTLIHTGKIMSAESFDFLNLDVQCAELLALIGYGDFIKTARIIYCEVNKAEVYANCPLVQDIDKYLKVFGFKRVETKWAGSFSWGDAIYIKR